MLAFCVVAWGQYTPAKPVNGNQNVYGSQWVKDTIRTNYIYVDSLDSHWCHLDSLNNDWLYTDTAHVLYMEVDSAYYGWINGDTVISDVVNTDTIYSIGQLLIRATNSYISSFTDNFIEPSTSYYSSIINGYKDTIRGSMSTVTSDYSTIIGGISNVINESTGTTIIGGNNDSITRSSVSMIYGSKNCSITDLDYSSYLGSILSSSSCVLDSASGFIAMSNQCGVYYNDVIGTGQRGFIASSNLCNIIYGQSAFIIGSYGSVIDFTKNSLATQPTGGILGGIYDTIYEEVENSVILGGSGIAATKSNTAYMQNANVADTLFIGDLTVFTYSDSLSDDDSIVMPAGKSGTGWAYADTLGDEEYMWFTFRADGAVKLTANVSTNTAASNTDNKFCLVDGGSFIYIKNRLGGTRKVKIHIEY